jgi:hypothetical protein
MVGGRRGVVAPVRAAGAEGAQNDCRRADGAGMRYAPLAVIASAAFCRRSSSIAIAA